MNRQDWIIAALLSFVVVIVMVTVGSGQSSTAPGMSAAQASDLAGKHLRATYSPLHFQPAIKTATNEQCLACHQEILEDRVRETSPAGLKAENAKAWYQQVSTYEGGQETFHRRHLVTPMAQELMNMRCSTCHQGHDPRDEAQGTSATGPQANDTSFTLRKQVNPQTCVKCHGQAVPHEIKGLPGPWVEVKGSFQNNCLACHATIRTHRHQVNYLNAEAIEAAAKEGVPTMTGGDTCFGCHGGRPWYRIAYPYPRNPWPGMPAAVPDWAKDRPTQSEARFSQSALLDRFFQPKIQSEARSTQTAQLDRFFQPKP